MTPATVHLIAQEIRHQRALLTVQEKWAQQQAPSVRDGLVDRIRFWRAVFLVAENRLALGDIGEAPVQALKAS